MARLIGMPSMKGRKLATAEIALGIAATVVSLPYLPFVIQTMWNWFVSPAFTNHDIGYFQMCGIILTIGAFRIAENDSEDKKRWRDVMILLRAAARPDKEAAALEEIASSEDSRAFVMRSILMPLGETLLLAVGWAIHTFLQ